MTSTGASGKANRTPTLGIAALVAFVFVCWWMASREDAPTDFDWKKEQRAHAQMLSPLSGATTEAPHVVSRRVQIARDAPEVSEVCETCHVGTRDLPNSMVTTARANQRSFSATLSPHPSGLLAAHPADMGCVNCHGGDPTQLSVQAHAPHDLAPASCARCHGDRVQSSDNSLRADSDAVTAPFEEGERLFRELRCAACHDGDSLAPRASSPLADVDVAIRPSFLIAWLKDPRALSSFGKMPDAWAEPSFSKAGVLLTQEERAAFRVRRDSEVVSVVAALWSQASRSRKKADSRSISDDVQSRANVTGASAEEGATLYAALGCDACHGEAEGKTRHSRIAPLLDDLGRKRSEDYLAFYLLDPARADPGTRMPSFRLDAREAASLAKMLVTKKRNTPLDATDEEARTATEARGWSERVKCNATASDSAPSDVTPAEMSRADCGALLLAKYGCVKCHSSENVKDRVALAPYVAHARETLNAHRRDDPEKTMPEYALTSPEVAAIATYLEATFRAPAPRAFFVAEKSDVALTTHGERLFSAYSCNACHRSGSSAPAIAHVLGEKKRATVTPPSLEHEGERARPEWLFAFLGSPGALGVRPVFHPEWVYGDVPPLDSVAPRMPTFALSQEEKTALVRYFASASDAAYPFTDARAHKIAPEDRALGTSLLNRGDDKTRCLACHYLGEPPIDRMKIDASKVAPSLSSLSLRRQRDFVVRYLPTHDPGPHALTEKESAIVTDTLFSLASLPDKAKLPRIDDPGF